MKDFDKLRVAIVHDWFVGGGAERVVLQLHRMFPEAPIYTSYCSNEWRTKLDGKVVTGWLQHFRALRKFLVIGRIWWFRSLDFSGYDLVISSSGNGEAKGIRVPPGTVHVCYCHSPTHFYWRHYDQYMARPGFGIFDPLARLGLRLLVKPLRRWDKRAAQEPDYFIANSTHIKQDIKKYYGRDSIVIHPPVDVQRFTAADTGQRQGFVTVGRQATYKRTDIIVAACTQLNAELSVIGQGPDHQRLLDIAGPTITFETNATDNQIPGYLAGAKAFLFAAFEDFGIAPIEAMAAGTPVIAYQAGGALDYVNDKTGLFFKEQSVDSLIEALTTFPTKTFSHKDIAAKAQEFDTAVFRSKMRAFLHSVTKDL